jgi:hypothetical protein
MFESGYLDFDLQIEHTEEGYFARVLNSPAGQAVSNFLVPFNDLELENFLLRVGRTRRGVRRLESPEMEAAKAFGGRLFQAVFSDEVRGCLRSSLDQANHQGAGLRIRLRLANVPELSDVPWEYLYNPALNRFLALSAETPLVRYLDLPEMIRPLAIQPPLRILVMIASPSDYPPLDVKREWTKLKEALGDLEERGLVTLDRLETATLATLQQQLRRGEYHIFHFIGHGAFDERAQDGVLLLEDEAKRGRPVSSQYLGTLMHDERTLRLAVLNACEGARTSRTDPFAGTAQSLVQQGIPAVIAMQFEITDEAAIAFTHEFYTALADGYPVDAALAEARKAIFARGNDVEWGTPVLYMRAPDGRVFDVERVSEEERKQPPIGTSLRREEMAPAPAVPSRSNTTFARWNLLLTVFILSVAAVLWSTLFESGDESISLKDFVGLIPAGIALVGLANKTSGSRRQPDTRPFRLSPSFDSGIFGGVIGGSLAGLIIGVAYYLDIRDPLRWDIIPQIFMYAAFAGTLLGASSQLLILWFGHLARDRQYSGLVFNEWTGGMLGGAIAGIFAGGLGGWFFGLRDTPFPKVELLAIGSGLGAICIVLGALLYDYEGRWRTIRRAVFASMIIPVFVGALIVLILQQVQVERFFIWEPSAPRVALGGAIIGLVIGGALGLQVGLTLFLCRLWGDVTD